MHIHDNDVSCCLRATMTSHNAPIVAIYDARGNGGGWNLPYYHGRPPKPSDGLHGYRGDDPE